MGKVLHIHIGQAGVQIGNAFWELYCLEHGIEPDGKMQPKENISEDIDPEVWFEETGDGTYRPRVIFIDSEPTIIDQVRTGTLEDILSPEQFISEKEDTGSNFARGWYGLSIKILDTCRDRINKMVEKCDRFSGLVIFDSTGGGTGSGLGSLLREKMSVDHFRKFVTSFNVFPSRKFSTSLVEPYNSIFSTNNLLQHCDSSIVFENEAISKICKNQLEVQTPSFTNLNRIIAQVISSISIPMTSKNEDFNYAYYPYLMILLPRMHFYLSSYVPLISSESQIDKEFSLKELAEAAYDASCMMVNCNPLTGKFLWTHISFRGDVTVQERNNTIAHIKAHDDIIPFVDWPTNKFRTSYIPHLPIHFPGSGMAQVSKAICTVSNSTSVKTLLSKISSQFDSMYAKKAFVHWYTREGMDEDEMLEARENVASLEKDYEEIEME